MTPIEISNNLSKIIAFLLVFFAFFLLTVKSNKRKSNQIFAFFLLFAAFEISGVFLNEWYSRNVFIEHLRVASALLQMPFLYCYVLSVCYSDFVFTIKHVVHLVLFLVFYGLFIAVDSSTVIVAFQIMSEIQYFCYIGLIVVALRKYKKVYFKNYANPENLNYNWLIQMTMVLLVAHVFVLSKSIIRFTDNEHLLLLLNVSVMVTALLVSGYFVLKALYQPGLFRGIEPDDIQLSKKSKGIITSSEINSENNRKIVLLEQFMKDNEPFLDADLTIQKLAVQLDFTPKELSALINHAIGKHFFDYVNEYRILKAMSILENPLHKNLTILEILYEVGFNSKSSFNTAFKKYSNLTPIAYRKQALSDS